MSRGVKKVRMSEGRYYGSRRNPINTQVTIPATVQATFIVQEWIEGTTTAERNGPIYWIQQNSNRRTIINRINSRSCLFTISKKLSGPYQFYLEGSLSGQRDFTNPAGMFVNGRSTKLIKGSQWRTQPNGSNIKNGPYISYGHIVYLWLDTEGLNGDNITIEVYNQALGDDDIIATYTAVQVTNGEVLLRIGNTSGWMARINHIENIEQFYIRAKKGNTYISDHLGDSNHAIYLNVKNELVTAQVERSRNLTPTRVYRAQVNAQRFEPCKFDEINVTTPKETDGHVELKTVSIFSDGRKLNNQRLTGINAPEQTINRTVYFDFNDASISPASQTILNNILGFLLDHRGTQMRMSGYACVIGDRSFNEELSQMRGDAVKAFFVSGGLDGGRIISRGRGEFNINSPDDYARRNERVYVEARRVDISFTFEGHDANSIIFKVIAGGGSHGSNITVDIPGFNTTDCYRATDKHIAQTIILSPDSQRVTKSGNSFTYRVFSPLPETSNITSANNYYPFQYIWPSSARHHNFNFHINSCRYYSNKNEATLIIQAYPDIKWKFAVEFAINVSNEHGTNMPAGELWAKHFESARAAGVSRSLIDRRNNQGNLTPSAGVPIQWGIGLEAEWNNKTSTRKFSVDIEQKIRHLTRAVSTIVNVLDTASTWAQAAARRTGVPMSFDLKYPKFAIGISWYAEGSNTNGEIASVGEIGLAADPVIGATGTIDLIAATIAVAGTATTGSPAVAKLIDKFRRGVETLGATVNFDMILSGEIYAAFPSLKFNSIEGVSFEGGFVLGGRFSIRFELGMSLEAGKINSKKPTFILRVQGAVEIGVGGSLTVDSDEEGLYCQPKVEFSGAKITAEIEGEFGWWSWLGFSYTLEEVIIDSSTLDLGKKYFI